MSQEQVVECFVGFYTELDLAVDPDRIKVRTWGRVWNGSSCGSIDQTCHWSFSEIKERCWCGCVCRKKKSKLRTWFYFYTRSRFFHQYKSGCIHIRHGCLGLCPSAIVPHPPLACAHIVLGPRARVTMKLFVLKEKKHSPSTNVEFIYLKHFGHDVRFTTPGKLEFSNSDPVVSHLRPSSAVRSQK